MIIQATHCVLTKVEASAFCNRAANDPGEPGLSPLTLLYGILADVIDDTGRPALRSVSFRG